MWTSIAEQLPGNRGVRYAIELNESPVSYSEILIHWQQDAEFRSFFLELLSGSSFSAFRWETPPITKVTASRAFEFVLLDSPGLAAVPDPKPFARHLANAPQDGVIAFPNLGKDAVLVVPTQLGPQSAYGHLASFVRHAPEPQKHELWEVVGDTMSRRLNDKPVWLSHCRCRGLLAPRAAGRLAEILRVWAVSSVDLKLPSTTNVRDALILAIHPTKK